ncbi:hypothetical protein EZV62_022434 [Acer yangbiense]|uniref:Protein kinase domain-containing protein n=1 Tax=Acer yangbiense TaxID=1000413 RepID=A0A5C7H9V8_9ROSI|nr:hypothetical protein EZV62_022434 [Acer yangbiense]
MGSSLYGVLAAVASFFVVTILFAIVLFICKTRRKRTHRSRALPRTQPDRVTELSSVTTCDSATFDPSLNQVSIGDVDGSKQLNCRLPLSWETRLKVIWGVANGLSYLHCLDKPIIHRDIKASNVLLDSDFEAHIADFGLARRIDSSHSHVSTQVAGTMGYMPPEYMGGNTAATVMLDVYSFGILMIETATQRRPNLPVMLDRKEVGLVEWARKMAEGNREMEMVESNNSMDEVKVKEYFRIACMCTNEKSRERPAMGKVVELLNQLTT